MVDLTQKPFGLAPEDIQWVQETIEGMTLEEKIGQLFINLGYSRTPEYIEGMVRGNHIGGARYVESTAEEIYEQNMLYQQYAKVPMLIASNCEEGGNGASASGTFVATQAQCGACKDDSAAYSMGYVAGREAQAVGCNWTFSPICDITMNWRNTIVNTRSFGNNAGRVIALSKAYLDGLRQSNVLACAKHFPGDGVDERDQHLVMSVNDLAKEEWDASFGRVYSELIEYGVESVMVGHIALPAYSRYLKPGIADEDILPASLSPELLQGLLRGQLGFNGLILTDASHMAGMTSKASRRRQVVGAITAGCDMFLFFHDPVEDRRYLLEAYEAGELTNERLQDALMRVLGMKAKLGLHRQPIEQLYPREALALVGCDEHKALAAKAADACITLVKDTQTLLPLRPETHKRVKLYYIESAPALHCSGTDPARDLVVSELERAGFEVTVNTSLYDMEQEGSNPANKFRIMDKEPVEAFREKYDAVLVFVRMRGYAQENVVRLKFSAGHSNEIPWWLHEVPTVCVSLNYTNHLVDLPMMKTFINAYAATPETIHACVQKIIGESAFEGNFDDNVWCGRWDTRL